MTGAARARRGGLATLDPLDDVLELMYYGLKGMTRDADAFLAPLGLGRAHHRILFVICRTDGVTVGDLASTLGITKQALHRPMRDILMGGLATLERHPDRWRFKVIRLTERGREVEREASDRERAAMRQAFDVEPGSRAVWSAVMARVAALA